MSVTRRLRMASLGVISTLIIQFILGMIDNLYGTAPAPGKPVGLFSDGWLALHFIVGILLLLTAIVLVIRAVQASHRLVLWTSVIGLLAIIAAIGSGISFTRDGANGASLGMSIAFAVALACYVVNLVVLPSDPAAVGQS
jgi:heme A synthase